MDEVFHLDGDEVVGCEPDEIGRGDDGGDECAVPEETVTQMVARRWKDGECGEE